MQIRTVANGHPMDAPYTPYDDLPDKLRKEMQLLQHLKDRVNIQARKVVDVAVTEWQEADARADRTAAALRLVRELTEDSEGHAGAAHEGETQACLEAFTSGGPVRRTSKRKPDPPCTPCKQRGRTARSATTGYFGVTRDTPHQSHISIPGNRQSQIVRYIRHSRGGGARLRRGRTQGQHSTWVRQAPTELQQSKGQSSHPTAGMPRYVAC